MSAPRLVLVTARDDDELSDGRLAGTTTSGVTTTRFCEATGPVEDLRCLESDR